MLQALTIPNYAFRIPHSELIKQEVKMDNYSLGIDIGSTTVKTVITDTDGNIISSKYLRHLSK